MSYEEKVKAAIPAEVRMISGCMDSQTSADVSNVSGFKLPDPAGRAGGALTSALLNVCYANHQVPDDELSYKDVLMKIRSILSSENFTQIPQLSSSRTMSVNTKFDFTPEGSTGTKRAVMIGINYIGQNGELSGCHNDVLNMKEYIMNVHGFDEENISILMDDGVHTEPTKDNIMAAYDKIVKESKEGDVVFCHYSGHGGKVRDDNGDEEDGYDETLIPVDYMSAGQIRDDDILKRLVIPMARGVFATCIMDCCHSGTVMDLPYVFQADGKQTEMKEEGNFNFDNAMQILAMLAAISETGQLPANSSVTDCCTIL